MSCAISPVSMAQQWRNRFAPLTKVALREKLMAQWRAIAFPPMAQLWRMAHFAAPENTPKGTWLVCGKKTLATHKPTLGIKIGPAAARRRFCSRLRPSHPPVPLP
jgi:hypothetical protein